MWAFADRHELIFTILALAAMGTVVLVVFTIDNVVTNWINGRRK